MNIWLVMILGGLITFGMRFSLIYLFGRLHVPETMRRALHYVPPAVLSAIIFPELFLRNGGLDISMENTRLLAGLIAVLAGCIVILASVPPVDRDALTHHLAVPKLYLKHGGMVEIPSVPFSYYPMNLDLLYLIPLYFGYDIVPKYIHFAFALLTAWMIYGYI